ncbi:response regulator transcription factor [Mycoplasmatota bacterium]|nr:response regulator transcription factor [Mycoplasmatota bacterium]
MNNILIVEDNQKINNLISLYCGQEGYSVYSALSAEEGLEIFNNYDIDIVISDLMLPGLSGEEMIKRIRVNSDVHIIILTAKTNIDDKLYGLKIGADDYIVKPFSCDELLLKIKNFLKKRNKNVKNILSFNRGKLLISLKNNIIKVGDTDMELTSNEYRVLLHLASNPFQIFTRDQLLEYCFGNGSDVFDRVIDVYIKNIRKKIKDDIKNPSFIKTIYGLGYKFIGNLDE